MVLSTPRNVSESGVNTLFAIPELTSAGRFVRINPVIIPAAIAANSGIIGLSFFPPRLESYPVFAVFILK